MTQPKARMTVTAQQAREIIEDEAARILGPAGVVLARDVWARRRPRGLEALRAVLWEIYEELDDPDQAESYVQRTMQRILSSAQR